MYNTYHTCTFRMNTNPPVGPGALPPTGSSSLSLGHTHAHAHTHSLTHTHKPPVDVDESQLGGPPMSLGLGGSGQGLSGKLLPNVSSTGWCSVVGMKGVFRNIVYRSYIVKDKGVCICRRVEL